jgi:AcrR family transcriptional regulator
MDDISLLAELSKGTLYNYFDNKEDLFNAICEDSLDLLKIQLDQLFTNNRNDLISNAELFYENFQKIQKEGSAKVFFEALSESTRNSKLQKILFKHRLKIYKVVENYLQIQRDKGFFKGEMNLIYIASGMVSLFDGITAGSLLGIPEDYNRKIWSMTIKAILTHLD